MDGGDVGRALRRIAHEIAERNRGVANLLLLGIRTGGVPLAERLAAILGEIEDADVPTGSLDVTAFRDDRHDRSLRPALSSPAPAVDDRVVVLVDDVLFTGRTIRAALDALVELGRPGAVQLAVLVDRGHRELPIRADFVGKNLPTSAGEHVIVRTGRDLDAEGVWVRPRVVPGAGAELRRKDAAAAPSGGGTR
jgi:pyrimidine operon attenuation protein/uracil phosphoribosyltransferase